MPYELYQPVTLKFANPIFNNVPGVITLIDPQYIQVVKLPQLGDQDTNVYHIAVPFDPEAWLTIEPINK